MSSKQHQQQQPLEIKQTTLYTAGSIQLSHEIMTIMTTKHRMSWLTRNNDVCDSLHWDFGTKSVLSPLEEAHQFTMQANYIINGGCGLV